MKPGKQLPHEPLDLAVWRSKREARARAEASAAALRTTIRREEDGVKEMHVEGDQHCVDDNDIASAMKDEAARADAIKQFAEVFDLDVNHDLGYVPREFPSGQKKERGSRQPLSGENRVRTFVDAVVGARQDGTIALLSACACAHQNGWCLPARSYINHQASERAKATTSEVDAPLHIVRMCQPQSGMILL